MLPTRSVRFEHNTFLIHIKYSHITHNSHFRAFWDSVRAGLQKSPPDYEHSLRLIAEIKGILLDLVPSGAQRAKDQINEVMDIELYKQQIENDTFNLQGVVKFVVELMLGLCAPARDATIRSILSQSDPVEVFREVTRFSCCFVKLVFVFWIHDTIMR